MQIVIDIPEEIYQHYKKVWQKRRGSIPESCIAFGTPLPKGHGRLIDEKEINTVVNGVFNYFDKYSPETFLNVIHDQCIEAVGADKAENEE